MGLMSFILILFLSLLTSNGALESGLNNVVSEQSLHKNEIFTEYAYALAHSLKLKNENKGNVINDVVARILMEGNRNIVEYTYQLWNQGLKELVKQYFPVQFMLIMDEKCIKLINRRDGLAFKLAIDTDRDGDRLSYSHDKTSQRVSWKMVPVWDSNRVYFKIVDNHRNQYLNLEVASDSIGDQKAFGSDADDTYRHQWYLHPVDLLFYIYNRQYNQPLKLGRQVDDIGDRMLWSYNGTNVLGSPESFG